MNVEINVNKEKVYEALMNQSSMDSYHLRCIIDCVEQIKHTRQRLEYMVKQQESYENTPYILYHKGLWDNYSLDLETLAELTLEFKSEFDKAIQSGKYLNVEFCKITHKEGCLESDVEQYNWDGEHNNIYVYEWDSYDGWHNYGELWALVVTDKFNGDIKDTLVYKNIESNIDRLDKELKEHISICGLFE